MGKTTTGTALPRTRRGAVVARQAHNLEVTGSSPVAATCETGREEIPLGPFLFPNPLMNEDAFLSALHDSPGDEVTWLALADWLEENGQAQRAELIRAVRQLRALPALARSAMRGALEARVMELIDSGVIPQEVIDQMGNLAECAFLRGAIWQRMRK